MPNTFPCTGAACFDALVSSMGLPLTAAGRGTAVQVVNFLRGGVTAFGARDEVLNALGTYPTPVGPNGGEQQRYSYFFQDDAPAPGDPPQFRTDGEASPKGYSHKLGDIFHSEPIVVEPPRYFQFLSANLAPNGKSYTDFAALHQFRRRVIVAGANDGFLHAFDGGVWGRDAVNYPTNFDLGTGREIFGYTLAGLRPPLPQPAPVPAGPAVFRRTAPSERRMSSSTRPSRVSPVNANRDWKTVVVGGPAAGRAVRLRAST